MVAEQQQEVEEVTEDVVEEVTEDVADEIVEVLTEEAGFADAVAEVVADAIEESEEVATEADIAAAVDDFAEKLGGVVEVILEDGVVTEEEEEGLSDILDYFEIPQEVADEIH